MCGNVPAFGRFQENVCSRERMFVPAASWSADHGHLQGLSRDLTLPAEPASVDGGIWDHGPYVVRACIHNVCMQWVTVWRYVCMCTHTDIYTEPVD